jgi:hypothetical protein
MYSYNIITEHGERYGVDAHTLKEAIETFYSDPRYGCARSHDLVYMVQVGNGWIC